MSTYTSSTNSSQETLSALKGPSTHISELRSAQPQKRRFATLKSILTGEVHKHNPRLTMERAVIASSMANRPIAKKPASGAPASEKKSSSSSTLRSIITGDVHKYDARQRLEESVTRKA